MSQFGDIVCASLHDMQVVVVAQFVTAFSLNVEDWVIKAGCHIFSPKHSKTDVSVTSPRTLQQTNTTCHIGVAR